MSLHKSWFYRPWMSLLPWGTFFEPTIITVKFFVRADLVPGVIDGLRARGYADKVALIFDGAGNITGGKVNVSNMSQAEIANLQAIKDAVVVMNDAFEKIDAPAADVSPKQRFEDIEVPSVRLEAVKAVCALKDINVLCAFKNGEMTTVQLDVTGVSEETLNAFGYLVSREISEWLPASSIFRKEYFITQGGKGLVIDNATTDEALAVFMAHKKFVPLGARANTSLVIGYGFNPSDVSDAEIEAFQEAVWPLLVEHTPAAQQEMAAVTAEAPEAAEPMTMKEAFAAAQGGADSTENPVVPGVLSPHLHVPAKKVEIEGGGVQLLGGIGCRFTFDEKGNATEILIPINSCDVRSVIEILAHEVAVVNPSKQGKKKDIWREWKGKLKKAVAKRMGAIDMDDESVAS